MRRRQGFALIAVLWLLLAVAVIALDVSVRARNLALSVRNDLDDAAAEFALDAAAAVAEVDLVRLREASLRDPAEIDPWYPLPHETCATLETGVGFCMVFRDVEATADLNRTAAADLQRLIASTGIDAGRAEQLAHAIADWRDRDDLRRARGAERADYHATKSPFVPRNGPFARLSELSQVEGVDAGVFTRLAPVLSVTGNGRVNINTAPAPVLLTLPGFSDGTSQAVLARRQRGGRWSSITELRNVLPAVARKDLDLYMPRLLELVTYETAVVEATLSATSTHGVARRQRTVVWSRTTGDVRTISVRSGA